LRRKAIFGFIFVLHLVAFLGAADIKTPAEEVRYASYSQNEDIARFLSRLQSQSEVVKVRLVGRTKEVDDYASKDLYLCLLTEEGAAEPQAPESPETHYSLHSFATRQRTVS